MSSLTLQVIALVFLVTLLCNTQYQVELVGVSPVKTATMIDIVLMVANVTDVSLSISEQLVLALRLSLSFSLLSHRLSFLG